MSRSKRSPSRSATRIEAVLAGWMRRDVIEEASCRYLGLETTV
ncbi:MAG TPA: hypothetical protein VFA45_00885 [Actinomycetes bacterium]|jgi:hypothetical protein|nr:hypothetical protein [Actinomycetes bacterium]